MNSTTTEVEVLRERVAALEAEQERQAQRHRLILQASLEGYHLVAGDRHRDGHEIDVEVSIHRFDLDGEPCFGQQGQKDEKNS